MAGEAVDMMEVDALGATAHPSDDSLDDMDWVSTPSNWVGWESSPASARATSVVIDTNVLIEDLRAFDQATKLEGNLVFCVPWIVLCELDVLKAKRRGSQHGARHEGKGKGRGRMEELHVKAQEAIRYLEHCFSRRAGTHSFLGQTLIQFKQAVAQYGVAGARHSNDDHILQCSLQRLAMNPGSPLLLLSNDLNLCLKTKACGLQAATVRQLMADPQGVLAALPVTELEPSEDVQRQPPSVGGGEVGAKKVRGKLSAERVGEGCNFVFDALHTLIAAFVEESFADSFGAKDWRDMTCVPPPWSLKDCFLLLRQHWYALDLDRDVLERVDLVSHVHTRHDKGEQVPTRTLLMLADAGAALGKALAREGSIALQQALRRLEDFKQSVYAEAAG